MKIHARITLTVEFIRTGIFLFLFYVWIQWRVWSRLTFFRFDWLILAPLVATPPAYVKSVFTVHVGGTRCVTSSTDNIMNIQARITLKVEFIRTCIVLFLFYVWIQWRVWSILTLFSILLIFRTSQAMRHAGSKFCRCVNVHEAHVGTTLNVTWSIDRIINMHSRIS